MKSSITENISHINSSLPRFRSWFVAAFVVSMVTVGVASKSHAAEIESPTLQKIKERGRLVCGVNANLPGFATANSLDEYSGLDIDFCRAVSTAVFGSADSVDFVPTTAPERFEALTNDAFDLLVRNTTWTLGRQASFGEFIGVNFYDGQGFMVRKETGVRSALELDNKTVCVSESTTTALNAADYFAVNRMRFTPVFFDDEATSAQGYADGKCDALTTDRSGLAANRIDLTEPNAHRILPEVISKEPLGPVVRANDTGWENIVRWSLNCMVNAEEYGVTSETVDSIDEDSLPALRRLAGLEGNFGELLGIDNAWCGNIIRNVGNYGESFARNVGVDTPVGLERGVNSLWTDGGLIYAPPIR